MNKEIPIFIEPTDWLVGLLYDLMRDSVPVGEMERIIRDFESSHKPGENMVYSNGYLASYAKNLADRIRSKIDQIYEWCPINKFELEPGSYVTRGPNSMNESEDDYPIVPEVALFDGTQWQSGFEQLALEIYCLNGKPIKVQQ